MINVKTILGKNKFSIIGMIHVGALPGTPLFRKSIDELVDNACAESQIYQDSNVDALLLENMNDLPYMQSEQMGPEITASMSRICTEVRKIISSEISCGIQILASANKEALAVAQAAGLQFIRAEGYVFSHIADEGFTDSCAGDLLRYRKQIGAENISVLTDIKKKHCAHSLTSDVSTEETAKAAEFFLTDGVIITGSSTGCPADVNEIRKVKESVSVPVLVGSGVTDSNFKNYLCADGAIIGSHFKTGGRWQNKLDRDRVRIFMEQVFKFRQDMQCDS